MARFQIFIPADVGNLKSVEAAFTDVGLDFWQGADSQIVTKGPDGKPGRVFAWLDPTKARIGYKPEQQTWIPSFKHGDLAPESYWVGIWNDDPPTEEDLRRPDHRRGTFIELGNAGSWLITTPNKLDRFAKRNPDGTVTWCVDRSFNWLVTTVDKLRSEMVEQSDGQAYLLFDSERDCDLMDKLLQVNYRITPEVCDFLELTWEQPLRKLIAALLGLTLKEA